MNYKQTIVLAALIGLMPACKDQINEPEKTTKQSGMSTNIYGATADETPFDSFMKHVPNVGNVKFFIPREENSRFYFEVNSASGDIYKMTEEHDVAQTSTNILYPLNFNRTDNMSSDGTASFSLAETTWNYLVSYTTPNNENRTWSIEDIPESLYNNYANATLSQMAGYARKKILERDPNETAHADSIWSNIYFGRSGSFTQNEPVSVQIDSKGAQQHLEHSDFGTITYTQGAASETKMYFGANKDDAINVYYFPAKSIQATAYANVKRYGVNGESEQLLLSTDKNAARYVVDEAKNETIIMPFNNWYTVTFVNPYARGIHSYLTDSAHVVPAQWQFIHLDNQENAYIEKFMPNGMSAFYGIREYDSSNGFRSNFSSVHFLEQNGDIEVVCQGYREDYTDSDRIVMTFCFGGTDRVNEDISTGLEMVYCAPQRQR
ncbi:MAG: hypothetical protein IJQ06_09990 [Paludibacteraceae bacterium]|nr:hypothetical protein [Paludibacteraceae bacterium]